MAELATKTNYKVGKVTTQRGLLISVQDAITLLSFYYCLLNVIFDFYEFSRLEDVKATIKWSEMERKCCILHFVGCHFNLEINEDIVTFESYAERRRI